MWPILTRFGNYELGTFGVLIGIAVLVGLWIARSLGERDNLDRKKVNDVGLGVLFFGFVGSKTLGLLVAALGGTALTADDLRTAGAIHGGLAGGALAGFLLAKRYKLPRGALLDAYVPAVAVGQAIGRLGCLAAGCCFGGHADLPWAITFTDPMAARLGGVPLHTALHPVQLYDAGAHILIFLLLWSLHRKRLLHGQLVAVWCVAEGAVRFCIEFFRGDLGRGVWFGLDWLSTGKLTALLFVAAGTAMLAKQLSSSRRESV